MSEISPDLYLDIYSSVMYNNIPKKIPSNANINIGNVYHDIVE